MREQLERNTDKNFVIEDKVVYDNAKVKFISYDGFCF